MLRNLIKKDFYLMKAGRVLHVSLVLFVLLFLLVVTILITDQIGRDNAIRFFFAFFTLAVNYILLFGVSGKEHNGDGPTYLAALPYPRDAIVTGRYLFMALPTIVNMFILWPVAIAVTGSGLQPLYWAGGVALGLMPNALILLIVYGVGTDRGVLLLAALTGAVSMGAVWVVMVFHENRVPPMLTAHPWTWTAVAAVISLALYALSLYLSIRIYRREDI